MKAPLLLYLNKKDMRKRDIHVNNIVITASVKAKQLKPMKSVIEPGTKIRRPIAGTPYDRRKKVKEVQIKAIMVLHEAGWSANQIGAALGLAKTTVQYQINPHLRSRKPTKRTPNYWKQHNEHSRQYRKNLEEEGLI